MSSSPPSQSRRSAGDSKKPSPSNIVTRNGARKAKIQTRSTTVVAKPSTSVLAAKKKAQQEKSKKKTQMDTVLKDPYQIAMESKHKIKGPTGFVTEPRMAEHRCLWDDKYPECPERLISVINRCKELNLIEQCEEFPPRPATTEEINTLHSPSVYNMLQGTHGNNDVEYLEELSSKYDAIYIHPSTHELALIAAGSSIELVDRVVSGRLQNGAALVRPPGHHAMADEPCGYCFYNNAALAANHALNKYGLQRILIVDWDVHHGQATQQMFYDDPRVLYFSIHRYEHGAFWPNLRQSNFNYVGAGAGAGFNCNVPLNATGLADADYLAVWLQLLLPMALEYQPELVLISAGYDAALGCPEFSPQLIIVSAGYDSAMGDEKGEMEVSPACYATMCQLVMSVCSAVCVLLEGGYCLPSLAEGAALTLRTLLGHAPPRLCVTEPSDQIRESILNCIYAHRKYWKCFNYQLSYSLDTTVKNVNDAEKTKHVVEVRWEGDETRPDRFATRDCYPMQDAEKKRNILKRLNKLRIATDLSIPKHPVGYIYDEAMLKHENICEPGHVECPERILRIHERHRDFGLLQRLHLLASRAATDREILAVHTPQHLHRLKELASTKLRDLNSQKEAYDSVYFHPDSFESVSVAMGCVIQAAQAVLRGEVGAGVCVVRPPGHHADAGAPSGFCLANSAAAAATAATRVLLLDWDVHHGNGTQRITYHSNQILYISIHRYDNGSFFPQSNEGNYTAVGEGKGEGFNINIPWNKSGMGDAEYMAAFTQIVLPVATEYNPDLVIVSAGFDACVGDPLGGCKVTPECFGRMTQMLRSLAGGRVVLCLEGGYNITSISYAMTMCTKALLGDPIHHHYEPKQSVHWSAVETINNVIRTHKKYWKSLKFQIALPIEDVLGEPLPSRGLNRKPQKSEVEIPNILQGNSNTDVNIEVALDSLHSSMGKMKLEEKCADGIHCSTDDEEENEGKAEGSNKPATLVDFLSENMAAIANGDMFAVVPLQWCPHLDSLYAIPNDVRFEQGVKCVDCDHTEENWVCLHCYISACGRHVRGHMQAHHRASGHALCLSLLDLSVWCSACDGYVDHPLLYDAKNNAHRCKFQEDMPWTYRDHTLHLQHTDNTH